MTKKYTAEEFMQLAINELEKCDGFPRIGCVIAKDGNLLSTGHRNEIENKHAERIAIEKLTKSELENSTIYTTLEPCVRIKENQKESSCTDLILKSGIKEVCIGVLDPNGKIYCEGYEKLLVHQIQVSTFIPELRELIETKTFKYGDTNIGIGPRGKRRVAVIGSGKNFEIKYSHKDDRSIKFKWQTLQTRFGIVDLVSKTGNDSIRWAKGAQSFEDITDHTIFRETSHFARMEVGHIAIIYPPNEAFYILIKLIEISSTDILFQWQVRPV